MGRRAANTVAATTEAIKKKIKDAAGRRVEYRVIGHPGLVLITQAAGGGVFYLFYTPHNTRAVRKLRLGEFPAVCLADATRKALEARAKIEGGADPFADRASQRATMTFEELALKFLSETPTLSRRTRGVYLACLKKDAFSAIGAKPATAVNSADILAICQRIKARGHIVQAQRTKTTIGGLYAWAKAEGYVSENPARNVPKQQTIKSVRSRTPSSAELRSIWRALDRAPRLSQAMKLIIRAVVLTGQRRGEVAAARVSELDASLTTWTIPADVVKAGRVIAEGRMKNGGEQRVYLSAQASALFAEALNTTSHNGLVFGCVSPDAVTRALKRICQREGIVDLSVHDMRRAIGNFLKDEGFGQDVRDLVLHHKNASVDGLHYSASARMEKQCREAWQLWGQYVERVVNSDDGKRAICSGLLVVP